MKIIHTSLGELLAEVRERGKVDAVRVAAMLQCARDEQETPIYMSWIVVTAPIGWDQWAEWRLLVGRVPAELIDGILRLPQRMTQLTEQRLAEVRDRIATSGLGTREGVMTHEAEVMEGVLG
ncbi:MAG TPA: hypothetical protein VMN39_01175 [Longimicrobiaceae bacterium]|nr:hypothetical protein [Longimicrobiaceae bacterium]